MHFSYRSVVSRKFILERMVNMSRYSRDSVYSPMQIPEPPVARFFFADVRMSWLWLLVRLYVGYEWLTAGWEKLTGRSIAFDSFNKPVPGGPWVFSGHDGVAIQGFVKGALAQASGANPAVQGWYATFLKNVVLPHAATFAYVVTFGEVLVGIALILGFLTGIAAFFGLFMNFNYLLAGAVSTNPILGLLSLLLVLAWRIAGFLGLDAFLLPRLGTPWTGSLRRREREEPPPPASPPQPLPEPASPSQPVKNAQQFAPVKSVTPPPPEVTEQSGTTQPLPTGRPQPANAQPPAAASTSADGTQQQEATYGPPTPPPPGPVQQQQQSAQQPVAVAGPPVPSSNNTNQQNSPQNT